MASVFLVGGIERGLCDRCRDRDRRDPRFCGRPGFLLFDGDRSGFRAGGGRFGPDDGFAGQRGAFASDHGSGRRSGVPGSASRDVVALVDGGGGEGGFERPDAGVRWRRWRDGPDGDAGGEDKRRRQQAIRRQQRGRNGVGNTRPLPAARPGSDQAFKEFKIGLFYDQSRTHVHVFATHEDHVGLGRLLRDHAEAMGWAEATEKVSLTDGAPWIRNQILEHLQPIDAMLLDFYHLSEHVWSTARVCFGEGEAAACWVKAQLDAMQQTGPRSLLVAIDTLRKKLRGKGKLESLRLLRQYIVERWEMVDYREPLARGWHIGSGPTEAMCKNLTLRLKRPGMKWDADHAAGVMNLIALKESGQWAAYWQKRKTG